MIIKDKMAVICRTVEEQEIYVEVATKEGWKSIRGRTLDTRKSPPMNYATGYFSDDIYPDGVTHGIANQPFPPHLKVVEAADLFRNQLIARRVKHEKGTACR